MINKTLPKGTPVSVTDCTSDPCGYFCTCALIGVSGVLVNHTTLMGCEAAVFNFGQVSQRVLLYSDLDLTDPLLQRLHRKDDT